MQMSLAYRLLSLVHQERVAENSSACKLPTKNQHSVVAGTKQFSGQDEVCHGSTFIELDDLP